MFFSYLHTISILYLINFIFIRKLRTMKHIVVRYRVFATLVVVALALGGFSACVRNIDINDPTADEDSNKLLDFMSKNFHATLNAAGLKFDDVYKVSKDLGNMISNTVEACQVLTYTSQRSILQMKEKIGKDKKLNKALCKKGGWEHLIFWQYCMDLYSLAHDPDDLIVSRLSYDLNYWREIEWIHLLYTLSNNYLPPADSGSNILSTPPPVFYDLLTLARAQKVDELLINHTPVDTVFIGDSIISLAELAIPAAEFKNSVFLGIPGERTDSLYYRLFDNVGRLRPKNVVISIGGNDIKQRCGINMVLENQRRIAATLFGMGVQKIYWISYPPLDEKAKNLYVQEANRKLFSIPGIIYIDVYAGLTVPMSEVPRVDYYMDGTHYNEAGYRDVVIPALRRAGLQ